MTSAKTADLTFADLDRRAGTNGLPPADAMELPLPAWHRSVYNTPLRDFSAGDLARACRQAIHPDAVVPASIAVLTSSPLAGDLYDGELLVSLKHLPISFWDDHRPLAAAVARIIESHIATIPAPLASDVDALLSNLRPIRDV